MHLEFSQPVDCLCDFTYDFYWQHRGSRLDPEGIIPHQHGTEYTYQDLVECLKRGNDVHIKGDAGRRLGSSLGVDLVSFGGRGEAFKAGSIIVNGNVDTRMGISMVAGAVYVQGNVHQPLGNVVEVESDRKGYRKYRSITDILQNGLKGPLLLPNVFNGDTMLIKDGLIRDTAGARLDSDRHLRIEGDAGMSTGILMRHGTIHVHGNAGMNTGVLLRGGTLIVKNVEEFAGSCMRGGTLIIQGRSKGYVGANMKGGTIFFKGEAIRKPLPVDGDDIKMLIRLLEISRIEAMMFKKYTILP